MIHKPVNENYPTAIRIDDTTIQIDDIVLGDIRLRMYEVPGQGLIVDGKDAEAFFMRNDLTPALVLQLKEAVEERVNARTQQTEIH